MENINQTRLYVLDLLHKMIEHARKLCIKDGEVINDTVLRTFGKVALAYYPASDSWNWFIDGERANKADVVLWIEARLS